MEIRRLRGDTEMNQRKTNLIKGFQKFYRSICSYPQIPPFLHKVEM
jgi:hypothetical protein